ncbi:MAG: DUF3460 family protein [Comamonas sp.]
MSIFRRPDYTSDTTQFIQQLREQRPTLEAEQRAGRALLWDKDINRETQADAARARVRQKPYVYLAEGK